MNDIRNLFPIFSKKPGLVYLDSAATAQKPAQVIERLVSFYSLENAPVHRSFYELAEVATEAYEGVRKQTAEFFGAHEASEIIFTGGATAGCNAVASGWLRHVLSPGDEIVISVLEHHSTYLPMVEVARSCGAQVRFMPLDKDGSLLLDDSCALITEKTKLVVCTAGSNVIGVETTLEPLIARARAVGAAVFVDAAQAAPRRRFQLEALGVDFFVCSVHKMCGPTGLGILYVAKKHHHECQPWLIGGSMVYEVHKDDWKPAPMPIMWEAGTPPIAQVIAFGEVLSFLSTLDFSILRAHEAELSRAFIQGVSDFSDIVIVGNRDLLCEQGHLVSFYVNGIHAHDVAAYLAQYQICVRSGYHCAQPLHEALNIPQTVRASWYLYTTHDDVALCVSRLRELVQ